MPFYLLSSDELRELFDRLGYRFTPDQIPKTIDYYQSRTSHGSTLSAIVHSWVSARRDQDQALKYFQQVLLSDIADVQGGTAFEGIHSAAMAGSVDLLQRCFTGLEFRADRIVLNPLWPEPLGKLTFPLRYLASVGSGIHADPVRRSTGMNSELSRAPIDWASWRMNRHCPKAFSALAANGRTPTVKNVGEPCAGEPHARFDGEGLETEPRPPRQPLRLSPPFVSRMANHNEAVMETFHSLVWQLL